MSETIDNSDPGLDRKILDVTEAVFAFRHALHRSAETPTQDNLNVLVELVNAIDSEYAVLMASIRNAVRRQIQEDGSDEEVEIEMKKTDQGYPV